MCASSTSTITTFDAPISFAASRRIPSSDVPVTITWRGCFASTASSTARPWWPGPCTTTVSFSCTPTMSTQCTALASGSNSVRCSAGAVVDIRCSSVPGKISMYSP